MRRGEPSVGGFECARGSARRRSNAGGSTDSHTAKRATSARASPVQALPISASRAASGSTMATPAFAWRTMKRIQAASGMTSR